VVLDPSVAEAVSEIHFERYPGAPSIPNVVGTPYQGAFGFPAQASLVHEGEGCRVAFGYDLILKNRGCSTEGNFLFADRKVSGPYHWFCMDDPNPPTRADYVVTGTQID
jgi:hypothetical protein